MSARTIASPASYSSTEDYQKHLLEALPNAEDEKILAEIIKGKDWVSQMQLN